MAIRDNLKTGGSSKKLYEALQYSGLVTEDMAYDEMLAVLAEYFPEFLHLYNAGDLCSDVTGGYGAYRQTYYNPNNSVAFGSNKITMTTHSQKNVTEGCVLITTKKKIKRRNKLFVEVSRKTGGVAYVFYTENLISNDCDSTVWGHTKIKGLGMGKNEIDISSLPNECYFGVIYYGSTTSTSGLAYDYLDIDKIWMEA